MKRLMLTFLTLTALFLASTCVYAQDDSRPMTKLDLAESIIQNSDLELPEGTETLSDEEYCEVVSNLLTSKGFTIFAGASCDDEVSYDELIVMNLVCAAVFQSSFWYPVQRLFAFYQTSFCLWQLQFLS